MRHLKFAFQHYLLEHSFIDFSVGYQQVSNRVHPTKLTDGQGNPLSEISAVDIGVLHGEQKSISTRYYLDDLYYDSELERMTITEEVKSVVVFTKIPKGAIRIPVAGGASYSPDFAYVLERENGAKTLHLVVESKSVDGGYELRDEEKKKIAHAEALYSRSGSTELRIIFREQMKEREIVRLIGEAWSGQ